MYKITAELDKIADFTVEILTNIQSAAMCIQKSNAIAILAAACYIIVIEAAPLSHHNQLQVALENIAELKGSMQRHLQKLLQCKTFMYVHIVHIIVL